MSDLFRKKSIERVTSPEQLNDYIRVSNPGVWTVLAAVVILLAGACVWGVFGRLDSAVQTAGTAENGEIVCYVKAADISSLTDKSFISVNEAEYPVTDIAATPIRLDKKKDGSILRLAGIDETDAVYEVRANAAGLPDGAYKVTVIKERVAPISFILN